MIIFVPSLGNTTAKPSFETVGSCDMMHTVVKSLQQQPSIHHNLTKEFMSKMKEEVIFLLPNYISDETGWAHSMQVKV